MGVPLNRLIDDSLGIFPGGLILFRLIGLLFFLLLVQIDFQGVEQLDFRLLFALVLLKKFIHFVFVVSEHHRALHVYFLCLLILVEHRMAEKCFPLYSLDWVRLNQSSEELAALL